MDGDRFRGGRLPISALKELERYQRLVREAAAGFYKEINPGRHNLPRGFRHSFHLAIVDVEDGSATSVLEREEAPTEFETYYKMGMLKVDLAFEALVTAHDLPPGVDWLDTKDFIDFGDTLGAGEAIEFRPGEKPIRYSTEVREQVLISRFLKPVIEDPEPIVKPDAGGVVAGRLVAIDADKRTFRIHPLIGCDIEGSYSEVALTADLRGVLDSNALAPVVRVAGLMRFDLNGVTERILNAVDVQLFEVDGMPWSARFIELATLDEGWSDGCGQRVEFPALDAARDVLVALQAADAPMPGVFPLESGGVQLEWATTSQVTSVEISPDLEFSLYSLDVGRRQSSDVETKNLREAIDFALEATR